MFRPSRGCPRVRVQVCASTPRPAACWNRASCPAPLKADEIGPLRGCQGVRVQVFVSTPRPAACWSRASCPAPLSSGGVWSLRADVTVSAFRFARRRRVLRLAGAGPPCPAPSSANTLVLSRTCDGVRVQACASTPRPAARTGMPDTVIDAGVLPAATVEIRTVVGFVFRGPPGRTGLRSIGGILPPTPGARWGNREPGVLARLPPHRAGSRPRADVTVSASRTAQRRATDAVARQSIAN